MAPPLKDVDETLLQHLAKAQLTDKEIAKCLRISVDTLTRRYADTIKEYRLEGTGNVRRKLYDTAMSVDKGAVTAMIFFLKNYGGMADDPNGQDEKGLDTGDLKPPQELIAQDREAGKPN